MRVSWRTGLVLLVSRQPQQHQLVLDCLLFRPGYIQQSNVVLPDTVIEEWDQTEVPLEWTKNMKFRYQKAIQL